MADPYFSPADRERIHREVDAILDGALSMGPNVREFEKEFAALCEVPHAIAMHTCTAALEIALGACGVEGGEVIVPPQTFVATGLAARFAGAIPVFAEISPSTLCLDFEDVKRRVTPRTRAIIVVYMAGLIPPEIFELRSFCDQHGIKLIEDAAHAPGAVRAGRTAGSIGHAGCFSFYPTKVMTSGEGGMLTTSDDAVAAYARSMQHRGRDMRASVEQYVLAGRNLRMTELAALLGRVQLEHLPEYLAARRRVAAIYREMLSGCYRLSVILPDQPVASSCWKIPVLLDASLDRGDVTRRMLEADVVVDWAYQPALHLQPVFRTLYGTAPGMLPRSEDLLARHVCLPCHPRISDADARHVARSLLGIVGA
jgi:perosamine synthetase